MTEEIMPKRIECGRYRLLLVVVWPDLLACLRLQ